MKGTRILSITIKIRIKNVSNESAKEINNKALLNI